MDTLIVAIIAGFIGYCIGWIIRGVVILSHLASKPEAMIEILNRIKEINEREAKGTEDVKVTGTELFIERVNDTLYAYTKDTNQFIAQGSDLEVLLEDAHKRFPNTTFFGEIPADSPAKELVKDSSLV